MAPASAEDAVTFVARRTRQRPARRAEGVIARQRLTARGAWNYSRLGGVPAAVRTESPCCFQRPATVPTNITRLKPAAHAERRVRRLRCAAFGTFAHGCGPSVAHASPPLTHTDAHGCGLFHRLQQRQKQSFERKLRRHVPVQRSEEHTSQL